MPPAPCSMATAYASSRLSFSSEDLAGEVHQVQPPGGSLAQLAQGNHRGGGRCPGVSRAGLRSLSCRVRRRGPGSVEDASGHFPVPHPASIHSPEESTSCSSDKGRLAAPPPRQRHPPPPHGAKMAARCVPGTRICALFFQKCGALRPIAQIFNI